LKWYLGRGGKQEKKEMSEEESHFFVEIDLENRTITEEEQREAILSAHNFTVPFLANPASSLSAQEKDILWGLAQKLSCLWSWWKKNDVLYITIPQKR